VTASLAILLGNLAHAAGRASSPGASKSSGPQPSFASALADQVEAQAPQTKSLLSRPLASQASGLKAPPTASGKPAAKAEESAGQPEPVDATADARAADEHALDALALHAKETLTPCEAAQPTKGSAKPGAEKSAANVKAGGAPIAQPGAQSGAAQPASPVATKSGTDADGQAGAGANTTKSAEQPAAAAKKVAAFVVKAPVAAEATQMEKPLPTASSTAPSTTATSSAKPAADLSRPSAVPFAHEAENDSSLHVALLPQAAHLRMEVEGAGDLSLHLRMRDGFAHVTVSGAAAPLVEMRSADLRSALAGQGLSLGQLEQVTASSTTNLGDAQSQQLARDGGSQSQAHDHEDPDDESRKSASGKAARTSSAFTISRSIASASGKR
jgi:flagellar hook-length control protein FliK